VKTQAGRFITTDYFSPCDCTLERTGLGKALSQSMPSTAMRCRNEWWCYLIYRKQSIRHSERSEESLRILATQNTEGFLASLEMTNEKSCLDNAADQMTPP